MWGKGENEGVGRQWEREGGKGAGEGGNREVRGRAMPGSHTVTMTTDITSQEQHLGCLCGLKWHSWRLALASCGCHNVPIVSWLAFCFISSTVLLKAPCCSCQLPIGIAQWFVLYVCKCWSCQFGLTKTIQLTEMRKGRQEETFIFNESLSSFASLWSWLACIILCDLKWCQSWKL